LREGTVSVRLVWQGNYPLSASGAYEEEKLMCLIGYTLNVAIGKQGVRGFTGWRNENNFKRSGGPLLARPQYLSE
jgi:hypothetical protein